MEEIEKKINILLDALTALKDGIAYFYECEEIFESNSSKPNERAFLSARDSIIQRFEYCVDLFWKVLKTYFDREKIAIPIVSGKGIIRIAVNARFLSENEGNQLMKMIDARNKTSHIYHENMAEEISQQVPAFYELIQTITERMEKNIK